MREGDLAAVRVVRVERRTLTLRRYAISIDFTTSPCLFLQLQRKV